MGRWAFLSLREWENYGQSVGGVEGRNGKTATPRAPWTQGSPFARATALRSMHEDGRQEPGDGLEQLIEEQNPNFLGPEIDIF